MDDSQRPTDLERRRRTAWTAGLRSGLAMLAMVAGPAAAEAAWPPMESVRCGREAGPPGVRSHPIYTSRAADERSPTWVPAEALLETFLAEHARLDYPAAEITARRLTEAAQRRPEGPYNLACALARQHRVDEAVVALNAAIDRGWRRAAHTRHDPDLRVLHGHDGFDAALERLERLTRAEAITGGPLRRGPVEPTVAELQRLVPGWLDRYDVPAVTVAIIRDGAVAWSGAWGQADRRAARPADPRARLELAAPMDLVTLCAAAEVCERTDRRLASLLAEADALGLRHPSHPATGADMLAGRDSHEGPWSTARPASLSRPASTGVARAAESNVLWPIPRRHEGTTSFLRTLVETEVEAGFTVECRRAVLEPLGLIDPAIVPAGVRSPAIGGERLRRHTALGTPLGEAPSSDWRISIGAVELARLVAGTMPNADGPGLGVDLARVAAVADALEVPLGLDVLIDRRPDGVRLQLAERRDGAGCLARWYPDHRCGVVVLFNSDNGPEVALRIAASALGGR